MVKPVLQALVLAEHVYEDKSGKKIIAGTFNRLKFTRKPIHQTVDLPDGTKVTRIPGGMHGGSPFAYMSLTDVGNQTKLLLQFVNLTKNEVLFGKTIVLDCNDRLATAELVFGLPLLPIEEAGTYAFEVVCEGEILGSCRIQAEELDFKSEDKNDEHS
ncbi:MAG: hypothetical protein JXM70_09465 [Pirellulales bacterium]|nr:hypothetical protein [Pirellulales bacterium]